MATTVTSLDEDVRAEAGLPEVLTAYVGGRWADAVATEQIDIFDPATERVIGRLDESGPALVHEAVEDAHRAWQQTWRWMAPVERGRILAGAGRALLAHREMLARLESVDTGKPISQARSDITVSARYLEYYAGAVDKFQSEVIPQERNSLAYTLREPFGVIAHITPWNAPISQMLRGVAPSLAAGNTVVVKPSELAPMSSLAAARIMTDAGLPAGVCNVVLGRGTTAGTDLVQEPKIRHITFTGSVSAGRAVAGIAASRIIGCSLELGGKSPTIVMDDADLDRAASAGALAVIRNSGQSCFATTRLVVHRAVYDQFIQKLGARLEGLSVGPGLDDPDLGPLVSAAQLQRVVALIEQGRQEGAELIVGGERPGVERGHFLRPTLLAGVRNDMKIAQSEVFGPVQTVLPFDDLDEAIAIANDTPYGLSAGIFTSNLRVAHRVAASLDAGQVQVNRYAGAGVEIPFGGYKDSGIGREKGLEALHHYSQVKSVIVSLD